MARDLPLSQYRNIGVIAHIDAGKTTVSERILVFTGRLHKAGEVHDGGTALDWTVQEKQRGITITSAATTAFWAPLSGEQAGTRHRINLIDTPGHVDFAIEVERSLRVLDGAVAVFDAGNGVEPQSEAVWRQADRYKVPRIAFINKMDKVGADFAMSVESMRTQLGANAVAVQLPLGESEAYRGVIDVIRQRAYVYEDGSDGRAFATIAVPESHREALTAARSRLIEACADVDDAVLTKVIDGHPESVTEAELERALRKGTIARQLVPVLCGSAFKNKGVQMLLDAIVSYLPSPADLPAVVGHHPGSGEEVRFAADDNAPFSALAFKLMADKSAGNITFLRVYSGYVNSGASVRLGRTGHRERIGRLLLMHANQREEVMEASTGMIVAAIGLKDVRTGDTLTSLDTPVVLESMVFPDPVVELAVHPVTAADKDRLPEALRKLALEDPSLRIATDPESGETRLLGMGELHLEVVVDRLRTDHHVEARTGAPSVSYRETVKGRAEATYRHVKQDGGPGQFAVVTLRIAPLPRGTGFRFVDATRGGSVPKEYVPAVRKGVEGSLSRGLLAGYPLVDLEVTLTDGAFHQKDSNAVAFEIAGSLAFQAAARQAGVQLLEPVMAVEVVTPEESVGSAIGDLNSRRGQILGLAERQHLRVVEAQVPLAELFGYVPNLRGLSHGRATATMRFGHYAAAPSSVEAALAAG